MRRAFLVSLLVHLALAAGIVALSRLQAELPPPEQPITVEIVSEAPAPAPAPPPPKAPPAEAAPAPARQAAAPPPPPPPPPAPKAEPEPVREPPPPVLAAKPEPPAPPPEPEPDPEPKQAEVPKPEPAPKKPEPPPKQAEAPKPEPERRRAEAPKPPPKRPEPPKQQVAAPKPPPEPKKAEKPEPEKPARPPEEKAQASDFDALLRSVEAQSKRVRAPEKREGKGVAAELGGTGQPGEAQTAQINPSALVAAISRQITPCWNIPVAAQGIGGLRAELAIELAPDGSVRSVVATDAGRMRSDPVFRAFAESAVRAVHACSPLKLPPESYQVWRSVIFNFDPSLMAG